MKKGLWLISGLVLVLLLLDGCMQGPTNGSSNGNSNSVDGDSGGDDDSSGDIDVSFSSSPKRAEAGSVPVTAAARHAFKVAWPANCT